MWGREADHSPPYNAEVKNAWSYTSISLYVFVAWCLIKRYVSIGQLYLYLLIYYMVQDIIWKADSHSTCQKISCFLYGTQKFITVFTKARHWTLSWAKRIQFVPSIPISLRSILMLSSHLRLGLPSGLLRSDFPTKTL
jgi:hypothetical protein